MEESFKTMKSSKLVQIGQSCIKFPKHFAECGEDNNWSVVVKNAGQKEGGYYSCTAFNSAGSCSTERILEVLPTASSSIEKTKTDDDTQIYFDDSVVSGDISDTDFMDSMVKQNT